MLLQKNATYLLLMDNILTTFSCLAEVNDSVFGSNHFDNLCLKYDVCGESSDQYILCHLWDASFFVHRRTQKVLNYALGKLFGTLPKLL